jgi:hypothetical protein
VVTAGALTYFHKPGDGKPTVVPLTAETGLSVTSVEGGGHLLSVGTAARTYSFGHDDAGELGSWLEAATRARRGAGGLGKESEGGRKGEVQGKPDDDEAGVAATGSSAAALSAEQHAAHAPQRAGPARGEAAGEVAAPVVVVVESGEDAARGQVSSKFTP